jgi:hypothetical protein
LVHEHAIAKMSDLLLTGWLRRLVRALLAC